MTANNKPKFNNLRRRAVSRLLSLDVNPNFN